MEEFNAFGDIKVIETWLGELSQALRNGTWLRKYGVRDIQDKKEWHKEFMKQGEFIAWPKQKLSHDEAMALLADYFEKTFAYDARIIDTGRATALATLFVRSLSTATFYTNGNARGGWNPVTNATFDGGVVAVLSNRIVWVWFEDED